VTLRKGTTADQLSPPLARKMEESSDRLQEAKMEGTDLEGQLMTHRLTLSDRLAELGLVTRKERAAADPKP
jgi:hypothetical protein